MQSFGEVDERGEDHHAEYEEEDEQKELLGAGLERVHQNLQAGRVSGELEKAENANDREEVEQVAVLEAGALQQYVRVERERGDEVDYVDRVGDERSLVGRDEKANEDLEQKPDIAAQFDVEEERVGLGAKLFQEPGVARRFVAYLGYSPGRGGRKTNSINHESALGFGRDFQAAAVTKRARRA